MELRSIWLISIISLLDISKLHAEEETKKNVATHPKIKEFNANAGERPTQCQGL